MILVAYENFLSYLLARLTIMVNNVNVSRFMGPAPTSAEADRKIAASPLYSQDEVLALLKDKGTNGLTAWTRNCKDDLQKNELDMEDVLELICNCMKDGRFLGAEWCMQKPGGPWAACDAYRLHRREWVETAFKKMDIEYYLKFAINKTGQLLLLVSCHISENRW